MSSKVLAYSVIAAILTACVEDSGPPQVISGVQLLSPFRGSSASVAYFVIENNSSSTVFVHRVSSPQFGKAEMHETTVAGGVSRMRPIESVAVPGNSSIAFATGGKHVMLLNPKTGVAPGSSITLEFHIDDRLLFANATLQSRHTTN